VIYNLSDTPVRVAEPPINYKGLASSSGQKRDMSFGAKLCLDDRGYSMEHNETHFTIFGGQMHLLRFYKCRLCACAEIIGHSKLTMEPFDNPKLLLGFGYNSMDTLPK
jgi:hypothetical protein